MKRASLQAFNSWPNGRLFFYFQIELRSRLHLQLIGRTLALVRGVRYKTNIFVTVKSSGIDRDVERLP